MSAPRRVAVIGAGWAGCAAAAELAASGLSVTLLEASDELGGRARRLPLELAGHGHVLDNGQHLLLGAYSETAALFKQLSVALDTVAERRPFELHYPDGFRLQVARLPAPWHLAAALIAARGLGLSDRAAMVDQGVAVVAPWRYQGHAAGFMQRRGGAEKARDFRFR